MTRSPSSEAWKSAQLKPGWCFIVSSVARASRAMSSSWRSGATVKTLRSVATGRVVPMVAVTVVIVLLLDDDAPAGGGGVRGLRPTVVAVEGHGPDRPRGGHQPAAAPPRGVRSDRLQEAGREAGAPGGVADGEFVQLACADQPVGGAVGAQPGGGLRVTAVVGEVSGGGPGRGEAEQLPVPYRCRGDATARPRSTRPDGVVAATTTRPGALTRAASPRRPGHGRRCHGLPGCPRRGRGPRRRSTHRPGGSPPRRCAARSDPVPCR